MTVEAPVQTYAELLDAAFDEVDKRYGGIEGYFGEALGLGAADQKALRDRYLT